MQDVVVHLLNKPLLLQPTQINHNLKNKIRLLKIKVRMYKSIPEIIRKLSWQKEPQMQLIQIWGLVNLELNRLIVANK